MIMIGDKREMVMLLEKDGVFHLTCIGLKRHYRKNGTCKHTDDVLARMPDDVRAKTQISPFGGANAAHAEPDGAENRV